MIFGNMDNLQDYSFLEANIRACFAYAQANNLLEYAKGSYAIDGDALKVNIAEYTTSAAETRIWEAHKAYLDLHLMLRGKERIDTNHIQNMSVGDYQPARDFVPMDGNGNCSLILAPGDFLICYPTDGHRTGICVEGPEDIKKAIFKIKISY